MGFIQDKQALMAGKTKLSANINKVATLRNARGKDIPNLISIAKIILSGGAHGLTVHPRPDERHIRYKDVFQIKELLKNYPNKEFNIEGYPSSQFIDLIKDIQPEQCTLVPDPPDVLTSNAGWDFAQNKAGLKRVVQELKSHNIRLSLFLDPFSMDESQYSALKQIKPDRIELWTEKYADSYNSSQKEKVLSVYKSSARKALDEDIQINAGHDLNQNNLFDLLKVLPEIQEVSIGQALIAEALEEGLPAVLKKYLDIIDKACG